MLLDQLENEKTRYAHDVANMSEKLSQSEGRNSESNNKYKDQVSIVGDGVCSFMLWESEGADPFCCRFCSFIKRGREWAGPCCCSFIKWGRGGSMFL